jgi:uncharacterized protein (DUF2062 family)
VKVGLEMEVLVPALLVVVEVEEFMLDPVAVVMVLLQCLLLVTGVMLLAVIGDQWWELVMVLSTPGVEGDIDRFRLGMDSERGHIVALSVAVLVILGMVPVLPEPVRLLLVLATLLLDTARVAVLVTVVFSPATEVFMWAFVVTLDTAWVSVLVTLLFSTSWETDMEMVLPVLVMVLPDLVLPMMVLGMGLGLGMACLNLTSVLPYLTPGVGLVSGVRRGGGNDAGDALGEGDAVAEADLAGHILNLAKSGRIVWGSGIVGRMGRIGAASVGLWQLVEGVLVWEEGAL